MDINYDKIAEDIIEKIGGKDNVIYVTHCMTRLRFGLHNKDKADTEGLKKTKPVLGVAYGMNQYQVILGKNLIPVFDKIIEKYNFSVGDIVEENIEENISNESEKGFKNKMKKIGTGMLDYVAASVIPFIPVLIGSGMISVVLALVSIINPSLADNYTYKLFNMLALSAFYFFPIFVACGAAKKLKCNQFMAMCIAAALIYPNFVQLLTDKAAVTFFGLPVLMIKYGNTILPALLSTYFLAKVEKFFDKIVPGVLKPVFHPMLTLAVVYPVTILLLGPIGIYVGQYIVSGLVFIQETIGWAAVGVLAGALPFIIMTGMHQLFGPIMIQSLSSIGYDAFFRPALLLHNMAEGGACIGVALRTKNKEFRSEVISCAIGCIIAGVTEPAIYGITTRLKKPLFGVVAGGFSGGIVAGIMGAKAFVMGASNILSIPIFAETILGIIAGTAIAIVVALVVTVVIGFEDIPEGEI